MNMFCLAPYYIETQTQNI